MDDDVQSMVVDVDDGAMMMSTTVSVLMSDDVLMIGGR